MHFVINRVDTAPDPLERGTGVIAYLFLGNDAAFNLIRQGRQGLQVLKENVQTVGGFLLRVMTAVCLYPGRIGKEAADAEKFGDAQRSADFQTFHRFLHRRGVSEGDTPFLHDPCKRRRGLFLECINLIKISHGF